MKRYILTFVVPCLLWAGCNRSTNPTDVGSDTETPVVMDGMPPTLDEHAHPEHGPHGGELVELGKDAYHAELVHGAQATQLYVLDSSAAAPVAIDSPSLKISLKRADQVKSFELTASPDAEDPAGSSSRFRSTDPELNQWLEAGAEGAVIIQIKGQSFTGRISQDHAGHDH